MPGREYFARVKLMELKYQIETEVGVIKAEKYFNSLRRFLRRKMSPVELSKLASDIFGRGSVHLHNHLLISMLKNASLSTSPPKLPNGYKRSSLRSPYKDFPQSPREGRTPNPKLRDLPSPLGKKTCGAEAVYKFQEQQSAMESISLGLEEDGEEVEQAGSSPIRAPLGIPMNKKATRKVNLFDDLASSCYFDALPETSSLKMRLEMEGLNVSVDCVNLLSNSVDVFLKRLIKPCLELAHSRSEHTHAGPVQYPGLNGIQKPTTHVSASVLDFRVAMELNPFILGDDWPTQLEKICFRASEEGT